MKNIPPGIIWNLYKNKSELNLSIKIDKIQFKFKNACRNKSVLNKDIFFIQSPAFEIILYIKEVKRPKETKNNKYSWQRVEQKTHGNWLN